MPALGVLRRSCMVEIFPYFAVSAAVLAVFGLPATLTLLPVSWRPWWPIALPLLGLATLVCVMQVLGTLFTVGGTAWVAVGLAVAGAVAAFAAGGRLVRPAVWSLVVLAVAGGVCALALKPSLRLGEPRPSGIAVQDPIYYLVVDQWLDRNGIRDAPPSPEADGFWATARTAWDTRQRVGASLADVVTARVASTDPMDVLPVLTAIYAGLVALAVSLLVIALGGPPWAAVAAALLAGSRPDLMRAALETNVAQIAGLALYVAAVAAIGLAVLERDRRAALLAGLLCAGLIGTYVEFAPALAVTAVVIGVLVAALRLRPAPVEDEGPGEPAGWRGAGESLLIVGAATIVVNPLAVYNGVLNLAEASSLSGESVVPFLGIGRDVGLTVGPDSIVLAAGTSALALSAVAAVVACLGLAMQPRWRLALLVGSASGALLLTVSQAWLNPYSYGLYKSLSLVAPFAATALALALLIRRFGVRVLAAACAVALLVVNVGAARDVSDIAVTATLGMVPDDAKLDDYGDVAGARSSTVAVEGTDLPGVVNAREHFAVYWLRAREGLRVSYRRGTGSYYTTNLAPGGVGLPDRTYDPGYDHVVSYGDSLTHDRLRGNLGVWRVYRRQGRVDLLQVGPDGWGPLSIGRWGPYRPTAGEASRLWVNATRPSRVRVSVDVFAVGRRSSAVVVDSRGYLALTTVGRRPRRVVTKPFDVPAGHTEILLLASDPGRPNARPSDGLGLTRARVREVPR